jgi:hypothetical protein
VRQALRLVSVALLAVSGAAASACGSGGHEATASQAATATNAGTKSAYLETLEEHWSAYSEGLSKVGAACPVPEVTVQTMNQCKLRMLALVKIDKAFINDLRNLDAPPKVQPPITALSVSLAQLNDAQTEIIRRYIDEQDVDGFEGSSGPGSPMDTAINANNAAIEEIDRLDPNAHLEATVLIAPS